MTPEKVLIPASEAAALLSMGRSTFWREVAKGTLPAPIKVGGLTRWRLADIRKIGQPANSPTTA